MKLPVEDALHQFVLSAENYFLKETWSSLSLNEPVIEMDFVSPEGVQGWIKISGLVSGWVMLTAPRPMIAKLVKIKLGEDASDEDCEDYIKEMVSVITSNSRRELGSGLKIDLPNPSEIMNSNELIGNRPVFLLSINWNTYHAFMVISLDLEGK